VAKIYTASDYRGTYIPENGWRDCTFTTGWLCGYGFHLVFCCRLV